MEGVDVTEQPKEVEIKKFEGYFSDWDFDENEKIAKQRFRLKPFRYEYHEKTDFRNPCLSRSDTLEVMAKIPSNIKCSYCKKEVKVGEKRFKCFECENDSYFCQTCFSDEKTKVQHKHDNYSFFHDLYGSFTKFPTEMREKLGKNDFSSNDFFLKAFSFYSSRYFVGVRKDLSSSYEWITYKTVFEDVQAFSKGLKDIGVKKGDFVAIIADIVYEYIVSFYSCLLSGVCFVPIQTILSPDETMHSLNLADCSVCIISSKYAEKIRSILPKCKNMKKIIAIDGKFESKDVEDLDFHRILKRGKEITEKITEKFSPSEPSPDDIRYILFTSGTTSFPKGVVVREKGMNNEIIMPSLTFPFVVLGYLPLSHSSGVSDLFSSFFNGGRIALLTNSDVRNIFEDFRAVNPTQLISIPRPLIVVYNEFSSLAKTEEDEVIVKKKLRGAFGNRLLEIVTGSSHCPVEVKRTVREILQIPIYDGFGTTEIGTCTLNYQRFGKNAYRLRSIPSLNYFVTDSPPRGELLIKKSCTKFVEYYKNPKVTNEKIDKDLFYHTGDIVKLVGTKIVLIDRINNVIKLSQGEFVSLENIEAKYGSSKFIDQIFLCPNPSKTALFGLVISVDKNVEKSIVLRDIVKIAKENKLPTWEIPRNIHLVEEEFSMTDLKKKNRRKIMKQFKNEISSIFERDEVGSLFQEFLSVGKIDDNKNLKQLGGDSLTGVRIIQELKKQGKSIDFNTIMNTPLKELLFSDKVEKVVEFGVEKKIFFEFLEDLKKKNFAKTEKKVRNIFVTGSTGFVGGFILQELMKVYPNSKIFCLSRKKNQKKLPKNVTIVRGDLGEKNFGLSDEKFSSICEEVDVIVHCGALVNHFANYNYHYKVNVGSIYTLLKIAKGYKPIYYVSSLSVHSSFPPKKEIEEEIHNHDRGYPASKWMTDALLRKFYNTCNIFRLSLVIGSRKDGIVNKTDWLTQLFRAFVDFKVAPNSEHQYVFNMVPVDFVAELIVKSIKSGKLGEVYNVEKRNVSLKEIVGFVDRYLREKGEKLEYLPYDEWKVKVTTLGKKNNHPVLPFLHYLDKQDEELKGLDVESVRREGGNVQKTNYEDVKKYLNFIQKNFT